MSELTKLVPPLELCKLIPAGEFVDSAFVWLEVEILEENKKEWRVINAAKPILACHNPKHPAPTLQEIMAEIPFAQVSILANGSFVIHPRFGKKRNVRCYDDNAATAALKLWLKLKGIKYEQEQG